MVGCGEHGSSKDGGAKAKGGQTLKSTTPPPSGKKEVKVFFLILNPW